MSQDALAELRYLFLGSRMKRLAERMQADALKIFRANGHGELQPAYYAVLATLDLEDALSISDLVERIGISQPAITRSVGGMRENALVTLDPHPNDQRMRIVRLTDKGRALIADLKTTAWRDISIAAADLSRGIEGDVESVLTQLETRLAETSLDARCKPGTGLEILDYSPDLARDFYTINAQWISDMFVMEETDERVLSDPDTHIISRGGTILFVKSPVHGIVGAGALMPAGDDGAFELTKMGVLQASRGEKAGEFLLAALIQRAKSIGVKKLFLLTNAKCEAAIHLYEKLGFVHDEEIMRDYGARYERCNVAMLYPLPTV